jgi:putative Mg2+ transporter-C (MgtC) family protein
MLTSLYVFDIYKDVSNIDPSRIASGVITGIGFLCAGTIMRYGGSVRGLTTAACLWVTAAVGLACGCGFFYAAIVSTIIILIVLLVFRKFEKHLGKE